MFLAYVPYVPVYWINKYYHDSMCYTSSSNSNPFSDILVFALTLIFIFVCLKFFFKYIDDCL